METKRDKFTKLAENRTNSIMKTIKLLGNLSNKKNYDYGFKDIEKIFKAIEKEVKICKGRFTELEQKGKFKL